MKKGMLIALAVVVCVILFLAIFSVGIYNRLIAAEEGVKSAWAQVENVYQRRLDLIPNLVEIVKGYAGHEKTTLQAVVDARSKAGRLNITPDIINNPQLFDQFQSAQGELSSALARLLVVVERYPDLKASENFLALQTQLEGTENRIAVERRRYNETAQEFNTMRRVVPNVFVAAIFGFKEKAYFKADIGAHAAPLVKF